MNNIVFVGEHSKTYDVQWHEHDYWELVYCTGGTGMFQFDNGTSIHYGQGEAVAIPPKCRHANISQEGFTNVHLRLEDPSFADRTPFRVNDDEERHLRTAFLQARYYYLADIYKRELVLSALGELIVSYLIVYRSNAEFSDPVEQIRKVIIRSYGDADFALDEAIREMPFHYDYLRKLFRKEMGLTPLAYLTRLRMKKAETMLGTTCNKDYSVTEIAQLCGYDDALYFSRVFKKHFGCSPSTYAKRHKADALQSMQE